jgi:Molecular chaperone (small heat shock protein)
MTDPTAIPINLFENDRELMVIAPMPGVEPEDISVEITDDGQMTLHAVQRGPGQEHVDYLLREWSYGPYERTVTLPCSVDARRANLSFGNGVLSLSLPKTLDGVPATLGVAPVSQGHGVTRGHLGSRGGAASG